MINLIFSCFLVGLPMCFGTYMALNPSRSNDRETGLALVLYAVVVTVGFVYYVPSGKFVSGHIWLKMPAILVAGGVIGFATGLIKRRR